MEFKFGNLRIIKSNFSQDFRKYRPDYKNTYYSKINYGGGAIFDALTHHIDLLIFFAGKIKSVSSLSKNLVFSGVEGEDFSINYEPGESNTSMFGGNSNWRGPVWFPTNYLLIESLREYYKYYGDDLKLEFPSKSGNNMNLSQIADQISNRLISIFSEDNQGNRPVNEGNTLYQDPHFKDNN